MSKNPSEGKPDDGARIARAFENADMERRLSNLESSVGKLENTLLERHARIITIIFSCMTAFVALCGILVTVLGWLSKSESREATKDMEAKVDRATTEMQSKFDALSSEALKKPLIQILDQHSALDGRVIEIGNLRSVRLGPVFLKNTGDKQSESLSIRLYSSQRVQFIEEGNDNDFWVDVASNDRDYQFSWYLPLRRSSSVSPKETWTMLNFFGFDFSGDAQAMNLKLLVYYGGENPAEADFVVKVKR